MHALGTRGCPSLRILERIYIGFGLCMSDLGEGPRKQAFSLDSTLSESRGNFIIGYLNKSYL
jgi:hypothetical protein